LGELKIGNKYYVRAYISTPQGTIYGDQKYFFIAGLPSNIKDIDSNTYNVIRIGNQYWMTENLRTLHYQNGDLIESTPDQYFDINQIEEPKFNWIYKDEEEKLREQGRLYTWYTSIDSRNICPTGWHVPKNADWIELYKYLGGNEDDGKIDINSYGWYLDELKPVDQVGFNATPGGQRNPTGIFSDLGNVGYWWSTSDVDNQVAWYTEINTSSKLTWHYRDKKTGFSIRCVKD
jgi:uncharacterized protein (TIGR02145 family)